jgi:hypothetical protein
MRIFLLEPMTPANFCFPQMTEPPVGASRIPLNQSVRLQQKEVVACSGSSKIHTV